MPQECSRLFDKEGLLRKQLEEFAAGEVNDATEQLEPYRKWRDLAEHLVFFFEFRLNPSAYVEGRFSVASNAARTKPASTTKTMSQHVRRHSNGHATTYPSVIFFDEIDPDWSAGDPPELPKRMHHRQQDRQYSFAGDFERLQPKAKDLELCLRGKYAAEFVDQFRRQHGQQGAEPDQPADQQEQRRSTKFEI